jgi:hypothetical protein
MTRTGDIWVTLDTLAEIQTPSATKVIVAITHAVVLVGEDTVHPLRIAGRAGSKPYADNGREGNWRQGNT